MEPNVFWFYNQGSTDAAKTAGSGEDSNFKSITAGSAGDTLVFTGDGVTDGSPTGTRDVIIIPGSGSLEIDKTFIDTGSTMEQVPLAGTNQGQQSGGDTRYVFCIYFDNETTTVPYLEYWDDANHNTINSEVLGGGSADNSMIKGIATTLATPGSGDWAAGGKTLAGQTNDHRLDLNNGSSIGSAGKELYFNLCCRVPSTASPFSDNVMATLRFTYT